jgi:hypothetical protein
LRYASTMPDPKPCEAPVTMATFGVLLMSRSLIVDRLSTRSLTSSRRGRHDAFLPC